MKYSPIIGCPADGRQPLSTSLAPQTASSDWTPLTESPDSQRLLGPVWTASGLTIQEPCRVYAGNHWRSGTVTATGVTFAVIKTSAGLEKCADRRNLLSETEAAAFKSATAKFRRLLKKRQEKEAGK